MSAYLNALREEGSRENLLQEVERQLNKRLEQAAEVTRLRDELAAAREFIARVGDGYYAAKDAPNILDSFTGEARELIAALSDAPAPVSGEEHDRANDLLRRGDIDAMLARLAEQAADLALYGAPDNARNREAMEATLTRTRCTLALMPAANANGGE